jgi:hypothetical protein
MAKVFAMPQPRRAYTPGMTASATFLSVMPHSALARSAAGVVMTPFGPVTVSMVKDGLCQEVSAAGARALLAASSARTTANVPSASTATAQVIIKVRRCMWVLPRSRRNAWCAFLMRTPSRCPHRVQPVEPGRATARVNGPSGRPFPRSGSLDPPDGGACV